MKKYVSILIFLIVMFVFTSCHEIGIREYSNEVTFEEFIIKYDEAYNSSIIPTYKENDFSYYYDSDIEEQIPLKDTNPIRYEKKYDFTTIEASQDVDNKIFKVEATKLHRSNIYEKKELNYIYDFTDPNEIVLYDETSNEIKKEHSLARMYTSIKDNPFTPQYIDSFVSNNESKFYIDDNVYTVYFYLKNTSIKLETATVIQITFKEEKVCYYRVTETIQSGATLVDKEYIEIALKSIKIKK